MTEVVSRQKSGKAATTCSVEGCETPALARGWCNRHYLRWRSHGDPLYVQPRTTPSIRHLAPGEMPPVGVEPRRYRASHGYVRLRWKVGTRQYVECFEHRWVMQCFDPDLQVHHKNHVRDDNRPENLVVLTSAEHGAAHQTVDDAEVVRLYAEGLSTLEVGRRMGHLNSVIYRTLVRNGVEVRPGWTYHVVTEHDDTIRALHLAGVRGRRIAAAIGTSPTHVLARVESFGYQPWPPGRPTSREIEQAKAALRARGFAA